MTSTDSNVGLPITSSIGIIDALFVILSFFTATLFNFILEPFVFYPHYSFKKRSLPTDTIITSLLWTISHTGVRTSWAGTLFHIKRWQRWAEVGALASLQPAPGPQAAPVPSRPPARPPPGPLRSRRRTQDPAPAGGSRPAGSPAPHNGWKRN